MSATDMPFERLEALLRGDEPRTLEEKNRASLLAMLRAGELGAPETLRRRVLETETAPATSRRRLSLPRRRLVLVLPLAAALAVGAALIHGAFDSGPANLTASLPVANGELGDSQSLRKLPSHGSAELGVARKSLKPNSTAGASRDYALPAAANAPSTNGTTLDSLQGSFRAADSAGSGSLSFGGNAVTIPKDRLVHADASLQVVVPNHDALTNATNKATQIVAALGGYAQSVQFQTSHHGDGNAYLDLRVPVGKTETAMGKLAALGKLFSQQVSTEDLQQQFNKQTNTIGRLKREIAIYQQALASGSVSGSQRVDVQIRLSNDEHQLTAQRKARSHTVASAATAAIQLQLTTNQHAFAVGPHKTGRLGRLLGNAADFLGLEGIIVLYILIVAGPIAILAWLVWWTLRERRRRDERRLLANA